METQQRKRPNMIISTVVTVLILLLILLFFWLFLGPKFVYADSQQSVTSSSIRLFCYTNNDTGHNAVPKEVVVRTDPIFGRMMRPLPRECNYVAALREKAEDENGQRTRWRSYQPSWPGGNVILQEVADDGIAVLAGDTLTLYDVVVSLAWEPVSDNYIAELQNGFASASQYLYDLTEGQVAFGQVTVFSGGENWESADFRALAANDLRPAAYVGGIVDQPKDYTVIISNTLHTITYDPGAIFVGRYWDGSIRSEKTKGNWEQQDAFRTLVHEWAHYSFFLYDEYFAIDQGLTDYCICSVLSKSITPTPVQCTQLSPDEVPSAMALHYVTEEFWHPDIMTDAIMDQCGSANQILIHNTPDWETLSNTSLFALDGLPSLTMPDTPLGSQAMPFEFARHLIGVKSMTSNVTSNGTVGTMKIEAPPRQEGIGPAFVHVYTLSEVDKTGMAQQIVAQGSLSIDANSVATGEYGTIELFGAQPGDLHYVSADIYAQDTTTSPRITTSVPPTIVANLDQDDWAATMDVDYELTDGRISTMTINIDSQSDLTISPSAQLCFQDSTVGCMAGIAMNAASGSKNIWRTTFTEPILGKGFPLYWTVHVFSPEHGRIVRWVMDGGGVGPGVHEPDGTPFLPGSSQAAAETPITVSVNLDRKLYAGTYPIDNQCSRTVMMPLADYDALQELLGGTALEDKLQIIGVPVDIDILLPATDGRNTCLNYDDMLHQGLKMRLTYHYNDRSLPSGSGLLEILHVPSDAHTLEEPIEKQTIKVNRDDCNCERDPEDPIDEDEVISLNADEPTIDLIEQQITTDGIYMLVWRNK